MPTTIDPRVGQWLNVLAFFLSGFAMAGWWQDIMTAHQAAAVVGMINLIVSTINFILHGIPSVTEIKKAAIVLLLISGALLISSVSSYAQNPRGPVSPPTFRPTVPTGDPVADIKRSFSQPAEEKLTGDPVRDLHSAITRGGSKLIVHLKMTYALAMAKGQDGAIVDPTSAPCARALVPIVDLVVNGPKPGTVPIDDPMSLTPDEQVIASDPAEVEGIPVKIEKIRILRLSLSSPALNIACGALVQDEVKQAGSLIGKITSLITGAGLIGIGL